MVSRRGGETMKNELIITFVIGAIVLLATALLSTLLLSLGAGTYFWKINADLHIPLVFGLVISSSLTYGCYLVFDGTVRQRRYGFYMIAGFFLSLIALIGATMLYNYWAVHRLLFTNPFVALWVSTFPASELKPQILSLLVSFGFFVVMPFGLIIWKHMENRNDKGAHFQSHWELAKNGHFEPEGFPIGKYSGQKVYANPVSLLVIATTGSYKTSSLIIPTMYEFQGSSISTDIKSEVWEKTASYFKANGVKVARLILFGDGSEEDYARINPFMYVQWQSEKAINMLNLIVTTIVPLLKDYEKSIWAEASRDTVRSVAIHFYLENEDPNDVTLEKIVRFIARPKLRDNLAKIYEAYAEHPLYGSWLDHWLAKLLEIEDQKFKDSLIYSAQNDIANLFLPTVLRSLSGHDVDLRLLRKERTAIYIDVPQGRSREVSIFLNLIYNVFMAVIAELGQPDKSEPYKILLNMEEFGDIGKIEKLDSGANTFRSFGLRFIFVVQNIGQIEKHYGTETADTFLSSGVVIKDGDNNLKNNRYFSQLLGDKIVKRFEGKGDARRKITETKPLMTVDAIRMLSKKYWLVCIENEQPIKLKKLWDKRDYKM